MSTAQAPRRHRWTANQVWAAIMLCPTPTTCSSVLGRVPVRAGNLNYFMLRRALRRHGLPRADDHIIVTPDMLDAIAESGPTTNSVGLVEIDGELW